MGGEFLSNKKNNFRWGEFLSDNFDQYATYHLFV